MRPAILDIAHPDDIKIFHHIRKIVLLLPDEIDLGKNERNEEIILSCHILARAVARLFPVKLQDGYFLYHWEHSWVTTPKQRVRNIIDIYPVAIAEGPILVSGDFGSPYQMLYQPLPTKVGYGKRFREPSFIKAVDLITKMLLKLKKETKI